MAVTLDKLFEDKSLRRCSFCLLSFELHDYYCGNQNLCPRCRRIEKECLQIQKECQELFKKA